MKKKSDRVHYQMLNKNKNVIITIEPPAIHGKMDIIRLIIRGIMLFLIIATVIFGITISFYSLLGKNV